MSPYFKSFCLPEWVSEHVVNASPGHEMASRDAYISYLGWLRERGQQGPTIIAFSKAMVQTGFRTRKSNGRTLFVGAGLRANAREVTYRLPSISTDAVL